MRSASIQARNPDGLRYRPDIDGLRGIAVASVALYHADLGCSGGVVGVDVFFVISGYLITSLIWQGLETGRFSLAGFWERRARRIVPAVVAMTAAVLVAGWFILLPDDFSEMGKAAAWQSLFAANVFYWHDSGYFTGLAETKPLLHTWSLAVEEQFYFVVPLLLLGMHRLLSRNKRRIVGVLAALGMALSLGTSVYCVSRYPAATFYLLPTRAWELMLGVLLAFLPAPRDTWRGPSREAAAIIGMALIVAPVLLYSKKTLFPGATALPPCLGAATLIWINSTSSAVVGTRLGRTLASPPLVFIGLISYSLYLWHWPILAYSRYLTPTLSLSAGVRAMALAGSVGIAVLSYRYIEGPYRKRKLAGTRKAVLVHAVAGILGILGVGALCAAVRGFPSRFSEQAQNFENARNDWSYRDQHTVADARLGRLT